MGKFKIGLQISKLFSKVFMIYPNITFKKLKAVKCFKKELSNLNIDKNISKELSKVYKDLINPINFMDD